MASRIETAVNSLQSAIDDGRYASGERLPPERELARHLGISRSSLRKALDELEARGHIWRHVGRGTFVTKAPADVLVANLRLSPPPGPADFLELRRMLEPPIAAIAALRATQPEIARLRALADDAATHRDDNGAVARYEERDARFHAGIAAATRNPLIEGLLESLAMIRRQSEWGALRRTALDVSLVRTFGRQHAAIVERIARRDPQGARAEMQNHLTSVHNAMIGDAPDTLPALSPEPMPGQPHAD